MSEVLVSTLNMPHEEWLKARKQGIGGSDVVGICLPNKYKSPMTVYLDKIGAMEENKEQSEAAYWGSIHEESVAREFAKITGKKVKKRNAILQHKKYPWMLANLDRVVVGEKAILECKTAHGYFLKEWDGEDIPEAYILQVQHYLAVTGCERAYFACLIGGNKFIHKSIERDEEVIEAIIDMEKDFWNNHVLKKVPPPVDGSEATKKALGEMYPTSITDEVVNMDIEVQDLIEKRNEFKKQESEIQKSIQEIDNNIKNLMGKHSVAIAGKYKINWSNSTRKTFDTETFKKKCPDIYKQYLKESSSRRFSISKIKEDK